VFARALVGSQLLTSWAEAERADASSTTAAQINATARRETKLGVVRIDCEILSLVRNAARRTRSELWEQRLVLVN